nr:circumsporozoite protein-like [Aegilops tauschii subsp. strangulata]
MGRPVPRLRRAGEAGSGDEVAGSGRRWPRSGRRRGRGGGEAAGIHGGGGKAMTARRRAGLRAPVSPMGSGGGAPEARAGQALRARGVEREACAAETAAQDGALRSPELVAGDGAKAAGGGARAVDSGRAGGGERAPRRQYAGSRGPNLGPADRTVVGGGGDRWRPAMGRGVGGGHVRAVGGYVRRREVEGG